MAKKKVIKVEKKEVKKEVDVTDIILKNSDIINKRIDRIVDAISKSKSVKGL